MKPIQAGIAGAVLAASVAAVVVLNGSRTPAYVRALHCVAKAKPVAGPERPFAPPPPGLPAKLESSDWAMGEQPKETDCEWLTVLIKGGASTIVSREPAPDSGIKMRVFEEGDLGGFECACSTGNNCEVNGAPAPIGNTLAADTWKGDGCYPKTCVEIAGEVIWPSRCPTK